MKIKLLAQIENRTKHFFDKFTQSEVNRCHEEGFQFMSGDLTMFRGKGRKVFITDTYDTIHFSTCGLRGQQTQLPIYIGKWADGLGIDDELDIALNSLNQKVQQGKLALVTEEGTFTLGQDIKLTTANFIIDFDPMFGQVEVKRRNKDFEKSILPRTECPFDFYDLQAVLGNHVRQEKGDYKMYYSGKDKVVVIGNNDRVELNPNDF